MDGLCIRSWDFERLQSWPPECTAVGCTLVDKKLKLVPRNAQITFDISLDRPLSDRTLVIELTLPNIAPGKLFEASLEAEEEMNYESLVLGKPNRSWSFVRREASRDGAPRETSLKLSTIYETGAAERHTMCLVVNVGNGHVSCLRDGVQLKAPTGVAQLASVGAGNDMQITLRNFGGESVVVHKVELWASASLTAVPTSSLTPRTTLDTHEGFGPSAPSTPNDPGKSPVGVPDKKDLTPPPTPGDGMETLNLDLKVEGATLASSPPGWKAGVRYRSIATGRFKAPRRKLPEPKYGPNNKPMIPAGATWSGDSKAAEVEVAYNAIVYKTEDKKYLVVRAKIFTNVQLAHDDNKHCGYFQEKLTFSMYAPGNVERSPGCYPLPGSDSEIEIKVTEKEGKATNVGATANAQMTAAGPAAGIGINAGRTWTIDKAEERAYKSERVAMGFHTDDGKLVWTWTVKRMEDGSLYAQRAVQDKCLVGLSTFARTSSLLEVQGTWLLPEDTEETVTLQAYVGQTLSYDAVLERSLIKGGGFRLKTCVNSPDQSVVEPESIVIPVEFSKK